MPGPLDRLQSYLSRLTEPADIARLEAFLTDQRIRDDVLLRDLGCYRQFNDHCYARNLVSESRWHQMYVLCWRPGQTSTIHDHRGAACGFRVLTGECVEVRFEPGDDGFAHPVRTITHATGSVCASNDEDIHLIANTSVEHDLVTLHIYSPALVDWNEYDADEEELARFMPRRARPVVTTTLTRAAAPSTS